jgi:hypothetical protein
LEGVESQSVSIVFNGNLSNFPFYMREKGGRREGREKREGRFDICKEEEGGREGGKGREERRAREGLIYKRRREGDRQGGRGRGREANLFNFLEMGPR